MSALGSFELQISHKIPTDSPAKGFRRSRPRPRPRPLTLERDKASFILSIPEGPLFHVREECELRRVEQRSVSPGDPGPHLYESIAGRGQSYFSNPIPLVSFRRAGATLGQVGKPTREGDKFSSVRLQWEICARHAHSEPKIHTIFTREMKGDHHRQC